MKVLVQLQNTKTKDRKRMRKELGCQERAWAGLHRLPKHRTCTAPQLSQERTTRNLFPLLCGVCSAAALEPSKCSWHLWECSVFLTAHPLCSPITWAHQCAARYHCRSRLIVDCLAQIHVLQLELHSGFVAKSCFSGLLTTAWDMAIPAVEPKELAFLHLGLGHLGLGRTWMSLQKCSIRG